MSSASGQHSGRYGAHCSAASGTKKFQLECRYLPLWAPSIYLAAKDRQSVGGSWLSTHDLTPLSLLVAMCVRSRRKLARDDFASTTHKRRIPFKKSHYRCCMTAHRLVEWPAYIQYFSISSRIWPKLYTVRYDVVCRALQSQDSID